MPFGFNIDRRLKFIQGYSGDDIEVDEEDDGVMYGLKQVISN
jgi:hypothetical protein